jgi:DASH complex subunit DAD1
VGNEFSSVEALWSQFEGVMGKEREEDRERDREAGDGEGDTTAK